MKFSKGDILVGKGQEFPDGAWMVDGYDHIGRLLVHPLGGGVQARMTAVTASLFRVADDAEREGTLHRQGRFAIGGFEDTAFTGWWDGQTWNGWAKPFFERAEAERLIAWLGRENKLSLSGFEGMLLPKTTKERFDGERDAFITVNREAEAVWAGQHITITDGSQIKAYALGAGCWAWREMGALAGGGV